ncbi:WD40-repeat-containing domain protein [Pisolithus croceorrhizus]|nr:WD40-repeat-containing domain protein [Pisolithus croceorrhizus]
MSLKRFLCFYSSSKYTLECHLSGHNDAILCLAVLNSGKTLASGGCGGLRLWDLEKKVELRKPNQTRNPQDPITCIAWLTPKDDNKELLCGGTGLGYLFLWKKRGHEFEETLVWTLDSRYNLSSVFSVELLTTVPHAIYSYGADVVVFGMYNGEIPHWASSHTLHGKDGVLLVTKSTGRLMGGVAVDQTRTFFVIDNAANGFSLHRMDDAVALTEEATVVVGGRENGSVYVFDRATRQAIQTLQHSKGSRVQMVVHQRHIVSGTSILFWWPHRAMKWKHGFLCGEKKPMHKPNTKHEEK